ncbi:hypothetical protein SK128_003784 [Halocaridina rubra]|uniref:Uncharacterized protein n=1 Tax=Halocaridina rubra TaxID=373956 RepID=A0AAN8XR12_HALRR
MFACLSVYSCISCSCCRCLFPSFDALTHSVFTRCSANYLAIRRENDEKREAKAIGLSEKPLALIPTSAPKAAVEGGVASHSFKVVSTALLRYIFSGI